MQLNDLAVFIRIVEDGSFTAAADRLGLPKSTVSRTLTRLEQDLGIRLLQRTTRSLHLTDAGRRFYDRIRHSLDAVDDACRELTAWQQSPRGHLRITMPVELGMRFMGELVSEFLTLYPDVTLEADLSGRMVDLVEEGVDLGLRIGQFNDANLIGRRLGMLCGRFYASPDYLARHGTPASLDDLGQHALVLFRQPHENTVTVDARDGDGRLHQRRLTVHGRFTTNNAVLQMDAVRAGLGIAMLPAFLTDAETTAGRLQPILPDHVVRSGELWAMTPSRQHMSTALRAFIDHLVARVQQHPWFTA